MRDPLDLGLDFGTSGARAIAIDENEHIVAQAHARYEIGNAMSWVEALAWLFQSLPHRVRRQLARIAIDGTSSTVLLCNGTNHPLAPPLLYHDGRAQDQARRIARRAPKGHIVGSATSSLAKLLWLRQSVPNGSARFCTDQASWLAALLTGRPGFTDYHNALKLGYDPESQRYPNWMTPLDLENLLPHVLTPGAKVGRVAPEVATRLDIPPACIVRAGTTDSCAAFMASGVSAPGEAVTSLGSTLVLKLLSTRRVEEARYGVYSHKYGNLWLAGGASNSGGSVLQQYFSAQEIAALSTQIDPSRPSGLQYYPLPARGERFPLNDPNLEPRMSPRPENPAHFLHGILEGIARIEAEGYELLARLGATPVKRVLTAGGGAKNQTWQEMRARLIGVPVTSLRHTEAAFGAARLALHGEKLLP
jgi:sugar (pentulose or hexulose) kinase